LYTAVIPVTHEVKVERSGSEAGPGKIPRPYLKNEVEKGLGYGSSKALSSNSKIGRKERERKGGREGTERREGETGLANIIGFSLGIFSKGVLLCCLGLS
jgi:hypothetical protein